MGHVIVVLLFIQLLDYNLSWVNVHLVIFLLHPPHLISAL